MNNTHIPVLVKQVIELLDIKSTNTYLDLTAGYGGHVDQVIDSGIDSKNITLVDRDFNSIKFLKSKYPESNIVHSSFADFCKDESSLGNEYDRILIDLGVSSPQLDNASRGFSFRFEAPLDMRMDPSSDLTAKTVVNSYKEKDLTKILEEYGDLGYKAKPLSEEILLNRPITTTKDLAKLASLKFPSDRKIATKVFQAIRIEVNDELEQIKRTLDYLPTIIAPKGVIAFISFHSLEDKLIKNFCKMVAGPELDKQFSLVTKKPIKGAIEEVINPRSRSAMLRVVANKQ